MERKLVHFSDEHSRTEPASWDEEPETFEDRNDTRWVINPAAAAAAAKRRVQQSSHSPRPVDRSVTAPSVDASQLHRSPLGRSPLTRGRISASPSRDLPHNEDRTFARGSNIASLIPRDSMVRPSVPPEGTFPPAPRRERISSGTFQIIAVSAGVSMLALAGTSLLCSAVILTALLYAPSQADRAGTGPVAGTSAAPAARTPIAPAGAAPRVAAASAAPSQGGAIAANTQIAGAPERERGGASAPSALAFEPAPQEIPSLAAAPPSVRAAQVEPSAGQPSAAHQPSAARPSAAQPAVARVQPAPQPEQAPTEGSWIDDLVDLVSGPEPARAPSLAATLSSSPPSPPGATPSSGLPSSGMPAGEIAMDDGLGGLPSSEPRRGSTADDASLALLASLEISSGSAAEPSPSPVSAPRVPSTPAASAPAPSQAQAPPVEEASWFDQIVAAGTSLILGEEPEPLPPIAPAPKLSLAETLAAPPTLGGQPAAATPPALVADAGPIALDDGFEPLVAPASAHAPAPDATVDGMLALLDEPSAPRVAPEPELAPAASAPAAPAPASGRLSTVSQPMSLGSTRASAPVLAPSGAPAADDGWFDAMISAGENLRALVVSEPTPPPPSLASTLASSEPVDLLEGEDGLSLAVDKTDRTGGFNTAAGADDAALALLAEVEASSARPAQPAVASASASPSAASAPSGSGDSWLDDILQLGSDVASRTLGGTVATAPATPTSAPSSAGRSAAGTSGDPASMDALVSDLARERTSAGDPIPLAGAAAQGPAPRINAAPQQAEEDGWLDTMVAMGTSIATGMGLSGTAEPQAPSLALDDGLDSFSSAPSRPAPRADDPALAMLADLDKPSVASVLGASGTSGSPVTSGSLAAPVAAAPIAPEEEGSWYDTLAAVGSGIVSVVTGATSSGPAVTPGARPSLASTLSSSPSASTPRVASTMSAPAGSDAASIDRMTALGTPVVPTRTAPQSAPTGTADSPVFEAPVAQAPTCAGELCEDDLVLSWRDPVNEAQQIDLLTDDNLDFVYQENDSVAELFYSNSSSPEPSSGVSEVEPLAELLDGFGSAEQLSVVPIAVKTSTPGVAVEIDGRTYGQTPLLIEIAPGPHVVRLVGTFGAATSYQLTASPQTSEWCFEARGRTFRYVRCS